MGLASSSPVFKPADAAGKYFVVTGANAGLGFEVTRQLVKAGGHVIMACRTPAKAEAAMAKVRDEFPSGSVEWMQLDLADLDSIRSFSKKVAAKHTHIDCLLNNGGVMWMPFSKTKQGLENTIGTNHFGHFALTISMLPVLKAAAAPRVVTVSSFLATFGNWFWDIDIEHLHSEQGYSSHRSYIQSKLANLLFTHELEKRLRGTNVTVVAAHPGYTQTELVQHTILGKMFNFVAMPLSLGAESLFVACTDPDAKPWNYYGPSYWIWGSPILTAPPPSATRDSVAARLWQLSEEATGLKL